MPFIDAVPSRPCHSSRHQPCGDHKRDRCCSVRRRHARTTSLGRPSARAVPRRSLPAYPPPFARSPPSASSSSHGPPDPSPHDAAAAGLGARRAHGSEPPAGPPAAQHPAGLGRAGAPPADERVRAQQSRHGRAPPFLPPLLLLLRLLVAAAACCCCWAGRRLHGPGAAAPSRTSSTPAPSSRGSSTRPWPSRCTRAARSCRPT